MARPTTTDKLLAGAVHGRGATLNPAGRFEKARTELFDDGWQTLGTPLPPLPTRVTDERARSILSYNDSPDLDFDRTINPYRGCEHGCIYCYARPSHGYLGYSAGLDFETQLLAKPDAAALLDAELRKRNYQPALVLVGANTDCYQPVERERGITRQVLQVLVNFRHPFAVITKSALILRDLDLLREAARLGLVRVNITVTTLDLELARTLEPRAATPGRRLQTIAELAGAGVPVGVMVAPVIPGLNDHELEAILQASAKAGAKQARWQFVRLPYEIKDLFGAWLQTHVPGRADRVWALLRDVRQGKANETEFGTRMTGVGIHAQLLQQRFDLAVRRLGLDTPLPPPDASQFRLPPRPGELPF
ncbi:MAG: PA0069 family radical SAM protein [Deltaproteobacteria bacterium]|nr:PA0069 family radical SAM protein [Deltaproteobacteria bacterium]